MGLHDAYTYGTQTYRNDFNGSPGKEPHMVVVENYSYKSGENQMNNVGWFLWSKRMTVNIDEPIEPHLRFSGEYVIGRVTIPIKKRPVLWPERPYISTIIDKMGGVVYHAGTWSHPEWKTSDAMV